MIDPKDWVSAKTAARMTELTVQWIRELGLRGEIPTVQTDLGTLYERAAVERKARERQERTKKAVA